MTSSDTPQNGTPASAATTPQNPWNPMVDGGSEESSSGGSAPPRVTATSPPSIPPAIGVTPAAAVARSGLSNIIGLALVTFISAVGWWMTVINAPSRYVHPVNMDLAGIYICQWLAFLLSIANAVALIMAVWSRYAKHTPGVPKNRDSFIWALIGSLYAILLTVGNLVVVLMFTSLLGHRSGGGVPQAILFGFWLSGAATMVLLDVLAWRLIKRGREGRPVDGAPVTTGWVELKGNYRAGRLERFEGGQRMPPIPLKLKVTWGAKGLSLNDGDEIVVAGRWKAQRILRVKRLYNATTGARFG